MIRIIALALILTVAGCSGKSVLQGGTSLSAPIANPISRTNLAQVESAYGIVLTAAVNYRRLPLCRAGQVASFTNLCAERRVLLELQAGDRKAYAAIVAARNFVRRYPTLNALDAIGAASRAVTDFRTTAYINGVTR